ncbi:MAG TPA: DUF3574 domain-containing protein [Ignavibacteria bacterium]|nr:DUF3574 domain-containing protein [Ignavibacteria bacterium]HMR40725.1 DUF3574 domain-containing protein [Ignavibacteria bacterium]
MTNQKLILLVLLFAGFSFSFKNFNFGTAGSEEKYIKTELFFGLNKPDGSVISEQEWESFADTVISKTFSKGATILKSDGRWLSGDTLIKEDSRVVIYFSRIFEMTEEFSDKIDLLREKYKKYYDQEAVLRTDDFINASF